MTDIALICAVNGPSVFRGLGAALVFAGSIYLVERRGKGERIDPRRLIDLSTLLESVPEAALIVDADSRIVDANSGALQLLGSTREQAQGLKAEDVARVLQPESAPFEQQPSVLGRALRGESVRHERRVVRNVQTGGNVELLVSANPIRNERGELIAVLLIARDITELTELQRHMGDVERHRAIGQMAAALAHDFNNVLNAIGQSAYLLQINADKPAEERKPWLDMIQNSVRRGAEIITRVREYLRTGSGALGPVSLRQVIEEAVELTKPLWDKAKVKLVAELKPVPMVQANAADLRRVFTNLIINATEAMPEGGQITLTCEERDGRVFATVADTGVGIPAETQKKVFFPYFTTKPRGTGLGLSGAQKVLLSQGGNISLRSEVGKGTTLTIMLPLANPLQRNGQQQPAA